MGVWFTVAPMFNGAVWNGPGSIKPSTLSGLKLRPGPDIESVSIVSESQTE
jgi:hypothetical protein